MQLPEVKLPTLPKGLRFDVPMVADPVFAVDALAASPTISMFGPIGGNDPNSVTATRVAAALRSIGPRPLAVQINSIGGDYHEGVAIYNLLRSHGQPVLMQIMGIAASAASAVAMAGTKIEIARGATVMIHRPQTSASGTADVMLTAADYLGKLDAAMAAIYAGRTGLPPDQIMAMMDAETFLEAGQAIELGFADALLAQDAAQPPHLVLAAAEPQTKRDLEAQLRAGRPFSKSLAAKICAGGFDAINSPDIDFTHTASRIDLSFSKLKGTLR